MKIVAHDYWEKDQVNAEFLRSAMCKRTVQFSLPTEVVLMSGVSTTPRQGRAYMNVIDCGWRDVDGGSDISKSGHREFLHLVEVWQNYGDDGHTDFELVGYATMDYDTLITYMREVFRNYWVDVIKEQA